MSLRLRLAILSALLILLTTGGVGFVAVRTAAGRIESEIDAEIGNLLSLAARPSIPLNPQTLPFFKAGRDYEVVVAPARPDAAVLSTDPALAKEVGAALRTSPGPREPALADGLFAGRRWRWGRVRRGGPAAGEAAVLHPQERLERLTRETTVRIAAVAALVFALGSALAALIAARLARPLERLAEASRRVAAGDLSARVEAGGAGEVAVLAAAFNRMTEELARVQARLVEAGKAELFERVAANIAHEIRNPLSAIRMKIQLLKARPQDPKTAVELDGLIRECDRTEMIVEELFALARPFELARRPVQVNEIATDALALWDAQLKHLGIETVRTLTLGLPPAHADPHRIRQVLVNLILNAMQAMPQGGRLAVRTALAGDRISVEIDDTGGGIPEEARKRLFEPFFTTKPKGTGIGLAFCRKVVDAHGGAIRYETSPEGTRFTIELPVAS